VQRYGNINVDDIQIKLDAIKQEPKERVQKYYERMDELFSTRSNAKCRTTS
jgi:hypothetical protein